MLYYKKKLIKLIYSHHNYSAIWKKKVTENAVGIIYCHKINVDPKYPFLFLLPLIPMQGQKLHFFCHFRINQSQTAIL